MKPINKIFSLSLIPAFILSASTQAMEEEEMNKKVYPPEFLAAITLQPDLENGKKLYRGCVSCHGPEGWGTQSGSYPQIAGQLKSVVIKQLADFRAGNRDNPIMRAFSSSRALGGPQEIADVAGYIANMPMTTNVDKGPRHQGDEGKARFEEMCGKCHGEKGEGDPVDHGPALHSQHFSYLKRQFDWIRTERRRNADPKMTKQIKDMGLREEIEILSYASDLKPPASKIAPEGYTNPDFPSFVRQGKFGTNR
jgi:cytochrome c553